VFIEGGNMAKKVVGYVKLYVTGGKATPAPPIGPTLSQRGINIADFCNRFNERTKDKVGTIIPVVITIYKDKTYTFILKTSPASVLIKKAAGVVKASGEPNKDKVGKIKEKQVEEIARIKMEDLNTEDIEQAKKIIMGTARSMGIEVVEE
jgi:large subunit ribosomal protein L11